MSCITTICYKYLWPQLKKHLVQLKLYGKRVEELKAVIRNLKKVRDEVQQRVEEEDNRYGKRISKEVEDWIEAVNAIITEHEKFNDEEDDHQLAVFTLLESGYLPKYGIRYRRSRRAFDITKKVNGLLQTSKHETFSHWLGTPSMGAFFQTVDFESFSSRDATVNKIKEALKIPNARTVGIHGLSGVGKTTLVKEIAREALDVTEADKMFDVVVMANVTRNPDIRKVQGQIADMLGMKLDEESEIARAARIRRRLMNEKGSTLIILDDIWAKLDLNMLGIPLESDYDYGDHQSSNSLTKTVKGTLNKNGKEGSTTAEHCMTKTREEEEEKETTEDANTAVDHSETEPKENSSAMHMEKSTKLAASTSSNVKKKKTLSNYKGCKVLLISESKRVLSSQMEGKVESIYFVDVLKEKETEAFFKKMAGVSDENSEIDKLATQIASKCYGLPMSIVATARALQNQSRSVWEDVHRQLERGKLTGAFEFSTRLSYDLLENEELKFAFLLCARMGPDALVMDLVRYCIGLGFLQGIYTVKEARDRVYTLVGKLKVSGLLSDSYSIERFTMQDIVRSAALSIASKENNVFAMSKGKIDEWPDRLERYTAISLHHCHIIEGFPQRINCPRLKVFHIDNNDLHLEIPKDFFKRMKGLRVLILSGIRISPVDSSIESLTELKMLSLEQCMLDNGLSVIGKLTKLRVLSFSGSDIEKLPIELKELKKLQIFDISNCSKLKEIPPNIISCFISLEELYMRNTFIRWEVKEQTSESQHASLSELMHLDQLTTLDIQIPYAVHLPKNLFFDKLNNYKIVIGDLSAISDTVFKIPEKYETSRFLAIQLKDGFDIHSLRGIKMLFERVEHLFLGDLNGVIDIFYRLNLNGFPYLKHLLVVNNSNIQSLIKPKERPHPEKVFPKLESLYLDNLENLDKVCSCKLSTPSFGKLKVIKINRCSKLQTVFLASLVSHLTLLEMIEVSKCDGLKDIVEVETQNNTKDFEVEFPALRSLVLHSLSDKFIGIFPEASRTTKSLFNEKVVVSKLQRLELSSIQVDEIWSDQSSQMSCFGNLTHLDVNGCGNLQYLISFPMAKSLINLQSLFISECQKMTTIFPKGKGTLANTKDNIFSKLKSIKLRNMKSLKKIWNSEPPSNSFHKLNTLIIEECDKLDNVIPCYMEGIFQSLCNLRVTNCKSMKAVFELDARKGKDGDVSNLQDIYLETLPKLEQVLKWSKDQNGILKLNNLQKMWVHDCENLENIFPVSVAMCLDNLEYLVIWDCFELREIVAKGDGSYIDKNNPDPSFEFPKLTTIKFSKLPRLACFHPGDYKLSCPVLNDLSIELCDKLEPFRKELKDAQRPTLFSGKVINKLKSMHIESWHAQSSSSYMGEGNHRQDNLEELCLSRLINPEILYSFLYSNPNIKTLSLVNCSFTDIVPLKIPPETENLGVVPNLKSLKLTDLPNLEMIGFERDIILQRIEFFSLKNCPSLVNIMPSSVSFTHLTDLEVVNCDSVEKLMPLSAAKRLVQLYRMKVIKCKSMVEIVGNEEENAGEHDIVFRKLNVLELVSLKNLNCFSKSCAFQFPSLEKLVVSGCPKMKSFSKEVKSTPFLQKIFVVHEKEKKIWRWKDDLNTTIQKIFEEKKFFEGMDEMSLSEHHDLQKAWSGDGGMKSWFCSLKTLKLENCESLSFAIPAKILPHLKNLKELEVRNCNKVTAIFEKSDIQATPFQLKNLTLEMLSELVNVWDKNCKGNLIFQNLQQVFVRTCEKLKTLFPAALARNLKKLEKLKIDSCKNLLEIIEKEPDKAEKFVFPCLTWLDLYGLPKLTYFYSGIFTVECPELHKLLVLDCPKLKLFQTTHPEGDGRPLFSDLKVIPILEELAVDLEHTLVLKSQLQQLTATEDLKFLKRVSIFFDMKDNNEPTFSIDTLEKAPNLQDLSIEWCDSLKIFLTQNPTISEQWILGQLKILTLNRVSQLQCISLENSWLKTVCKNLHKLNVSNCPDLTKLFHSPSEISLSNLKELYISKCQELEYLFTSSVAKLLTHLEEITVKECPKIKEIVVKVQDGTPRLQDETPRQEIKFEWLYCINLDSLSSLECFYSGDDILELPSLTQVDIWQCPKMEFFSRQINVKSFRGIQASSDSNDELFFHKNLNTSVKSAFLLQMLSKGMDGISFSKHSELQDAWNKRLSPQNNWFYTLRTLKLDNCDFKQYAISSNILPCLKNLKELEVRNCNKVEVIFDMNGTNNMETSQLSNLTLEGLSELTSVWENNCQGILVFQNLQRVSVTGCKSIQALLPATLARKLTLLEKLEIKSCDKLQVIVGKEEDATEDVTKKFMFPRLHSFDLYFLPELASFYPEMFTVECPRLNNLSVLDCPKLELFHSTHHEDVDKSSDTSINRQPLFSDSKAISIVESLLLNQKHISELRLGQPRESLEHLNRIHLCFHSDENEKPTFPCEIFDIAPNLQEMMLECCDRLDIFFTPNPIFSEHELIGHLKVLELNKVSKLKFIGSRDSSWLNKVCEELQRLTVQICPDLTALVDSESAVSFSNLKELYITECDALEYLFTSSTTKKLIHLQKITVKNCKSMKTVVAKNEDEAPQGVEFKLLCRIDLISLSSLDCFYPGNDILQLPSFAQVHIWRCPKMKVFSHGEIYANSCRGIYGQPNSKNKWVLDSDLNSSTKLIYQLQRLKELNLSKQKIQDTAKGKLVSIVGTSNTGLQTLALSFDEKPVCSTILDMGRLPIFEKLGSNILKPARLQTLALSFDEKPVCSTILDMGRLPIFKKLGSNILKPARLQTLALSFDEKPVCSTILDMGRLPIFRKLGSSILNPERTRFSSNKRDDIEKRVLKK